MKEAYLYQKLEDKKTRCQTCSHYCLIDPNQRGACRVKKNINGVLYALNYGKVVAINIDPIEKKPFFHFLPGSQSLSFAATGCNFRCLNCQNFDISQGFGDNQENIPGEKLSPQEIIKIALKHKVMSISYTYAEPTIFLEYALETMKLAKEKGLKNNFISNGFLSKESIDLIAPYLDAINIDIKSFSDEFYKEVCGGRLEPVLNSAKLMKQLGIWLEITTLAIPSLSDSKKMFQEIAEFIKKELGVETPWHISKFSGKISCKLKHLPETSFDNLQMAYRIGKENGLKYVYSGNMPGLPSEDTFCPKCNALMIDRTGYDISRYDEKGLCAKCNTGLDLILE